MYDTTLVLLLIILNPLYISGQDEKQTIESKLLRIHALADSAQFDKALDLSKIIYTEYISESEVSDTTAAKIYNAMSSIFAKKIETDSSIFYANKALELLNVSYNDHLERAYSFNILGLSYYRIAQFNQSIEYLEKGLEIIKHRLGENHFEATKYYGNLGLSLISIGETEKAIAYLEKNLEILLALYGNNHINVAKTYTNLGAIYYSLGDYDKVLDYNLKAMRIKKILMGEHHPSLGNTLSNIGSMYIEKGDFEKSITYIQEGLTVIKKALGDTHPNLTNSHRILGNCYAELKDYQKGIEHYKKAIHIAQINYGKDHFWAGVPYLSLSELYRKIEDYEQAEKYGKKALEIFSSAHKKDHKEIISCYELLGNISISKGENDKAIKYYEEALKFFANRTIKGPDRAGPLLSIGAAHANNKEFLKANTYYNRCAKALNYNPNTPTVFDQVNNLIVLRSLLKYKRDYYTKLYQQDQNINYRDSIQLNDEYAFALEDYFLLSLADQESRSFHFADAFWLYESAIEHLVQNKSTEDFLKAFEIAEKSKSRFLAENFRSVNAKNIIGISTGLLEEEHQIDVDMAYYDKKLFQEHYEKETPSDSIIDIYNSHLFNIKQQRENLIQTFQDKYPAYHRLKYDQRITSISDIQSILQTDQALIEYFVGDSTIFIFVITQEQYIVKSIKKNFQLEEWVKSLRENIYSYWIMKGQSDADYQKHNKLYAEVAFQLHEKLIAPIQSSLPDKLIIVPDGVLNFIPFEALLTEQPKDNQDYKSYAYLLKKYQISYNYSATLFKELSGRKNITSDISLAAFAPTFKEDTSAYDSLVELRSGFGPLKYNKVEAETIHSLIGGDLFVGNQATEDQFLKLANQYQIIHLSTHGKSNDQMGEYSFVGFTEIQDSISDNERLYVRELYNMQLNADMVVLSACETGLGEMKRGEGIIGLARGFTFAGAASTVTSLWSVNDIQTTQLMTRFYENINDGMTKDAALRQAKISYLEEESHADPYFWSAFIAAGNMNPIDLDKGWSWWCYGLIAIGMIGLLLLLRNKQ